MRGGNLSDFFITVSVELSNPALLPPGGVVPFLPDPINVDAGLRQ